MVHFPLLSYLHLSIGEFPIEALELNLAIGPTLAIHRRNHPPQRYDPYLKGNNQDHTFDFSLYIILLILDCNETRPIC